MSTRSRMLSIDRVKLSTICQISLTGCAPGRQRSANSVAQLYEPACLHDGCDHIKRFTRPRVYCDHQALGFGLRCEVVANVSSIRTALANRALLALMTGHFVNDMFAAILPMMYPIAKAEFGVSNADVGFLTLAYTTTSSILQPFFGHVSDRWRSPWLAPAILVWSTIWVSSYGFADSYWVLFAVAALAGVGSGAYHPLGASAAARVSDPRVRNTALSLYTVGGTSGYALGPLLAVAMLGWFGARGTLAFAIPGTIGALLLARQMGLVMRTGAVRSAGNTGAESVPYRLLARVVGVVMLRSWSFMALLQFIPVWYDDLGYGRGTYGALSTTMIGAGVIGTLTGGALADRFGGKRIIVVTQLLCVPVLLGFVQYPGALAFGFGALFGLFSDSSLSVTLTAAQRLLPGRTGIASGVILGIGFITSGVGVPIIGFVGDRVGIDVALAALSLPCLGAAVLAWTTSDLLYRDAGTPTSAT